jgi:hypothetical protein
MCSIFLRIGALWRGSPISVSVVVPKIRSFCSLFESLPQPALDLSVVCISVRLPPNLRYFVCLLHGCVHFVTRVRFGRRPILLVSDFMLLGEDLTRTGSCVVRALELRVLRCVFGRHQGFRLFPLTGKSAGRILPSPLCSGFPAAATGWHLISRRLFPLGVFICT